MVLAASTPTEAVGLAVLFVLVIFLLFGALFCYKLFKLVWIRSRGSWRRH